LASRRDSSVSRSSSSARRLRSSFCPPGMLYIVKRYVVLPPRAVGTLFSMSRICQTRPSCSTTLPLRISFALMASSLRLQADGAIDSDGFAVEVAVFQDERGGGGE